MGAGAARCDGDGEDLHDGEGHRRGAAPDAYHSPNKTLAAQTASEFKDFFPDNAVYYFVSYYDYYQPESYVPQTDTYIEKDSSRNEEIDRLRHSATMALFERRDVIIVASVSCIYGLGDPEDYSSMGLSLRPGEEIQRDKDPGKARQYAVYAE